MNFKKDCDNGDVTTDYILEHFDNLVDKWHESDEKCDVYEYLGLSLDDYCLYVLYPDDFANLVKKGGIQVGL